MDVGSQSSSLKSSSVAASSAVSSSSIPNNSSKFCSGASTLPTTIVQLPISSYFPAVAAQASQAAATATTMQFYTQSAQLPHNSQGNVADGQAGQNNPNANPLQQPQQLFLNPALAYQQWFGQQLQQQQQDGQVTFATIPSGGDGNAVAFYNMEPHNQQNVEFHNGSVQMGTDGALSLSTLQSFANSLQQHGPGQAFMIQATPVAANSNGMPTLSYTTNQVMDQHHGQQQAHQNQLQNQQQVSSANKGKAPRKPKAHAVQQTPPQPPPHADTKAVKPPKPKGSPNAYALFYKDTYTKLRAENPEWKASQIMAEAGKIWKEMNGSNQDTYRSRAETLNQQHQLANANNKASHKKQKNQQKRPMTAYQLFIREHFGRRPPEVAQMHAKDFLLQLSVQWKNLEPNEKLMYQDKAKAEKTRRENEGELASNGAVLAAPMTAMPQIKMESSSVAAVPAGFSSASS